MQTITVPNSVAKIIQKPGFSRFVRSEAFEDALILYYVESISSQDSKAFISSSQFKKKYASSRQ